MGRGRWLFHWYEGLGVAVLIEEGRERFGTYVQVYINWASAKLWGEAILKDVSCHGCIPEEQLFNMVVPTTVKQSDG